jgi:hypothetical protein
MKTHTLSAVVFTLLAPLASGQGTFVYDQQSADENAGGGAAIGIQASQPLGQSFIPTMSSVGFIRLDVGDSSFNGLGATLYLNLRTDSITGPILASTDSVFMPDRFSGYTNFFFSTPAAVTPGTTYYFQPVVQSGDVWSIIAYSYGYPRGTEIYQGSPLPSSDLWFREGIIVPEPSAALIGFMGLGLLVWLRDKQRVRG